jgi:flagellar motor protein MotB
MKNFFSALVMASLLPVSALHADTTSTPPTPPPSSAQPPAAKDQAGNSADQTDNNYYWQGTQLYNLGRLGEAFDSFEKAVQKKQNSKEAEAYLLQIKQEIVNNAKKRQEERATLNYGGNNPDNALNVSTLDKGYIRVELQAKFLFDDNSASLRAGGMDILNRLADIMAAKEGNHVELTMKDELDASTTAKDIDAERTLLIFSYLNFKRLGNDQQG